MKMVLCGDIGGTNANFCLAEINDRVSMHAIKHEKTQAFADFPALVRHYLNTVGEIPEAACFAVAGPVANQRGEMTNARLVIDAREIEQRTPLKRVLVINDFQAIGYGVNILEESEVQVLNRGISKEGATRSVVGAGTGLGKNILILDKAKNAYIPYPSEGGHADFPFRPEEEALRQFLIMEEAPTGPIVYETLLSGKGLERIYRFVQKTQFPGEAARSAKEISRDRHTSLCCREAFALFIRFYARCAKNFALDTLSLSGVYLAGGIAAANSDLFGADFTEEFTRHQSERFAALLQEIPVTLINNYDISLKGAAFALKVCGMR